MLTFNELAAALSVLSWHPGWTLSVVTDRWEGPVLRVEADTPNSYQSGETVHLDIRSHIPPMASVEQFHTWLAWRLGRIAIHESLEWLRRDGKPLFDPHDI